MQLFTLSITDLTTFESVPHEVWAETEDLFEVGNSFAQTMLAVNPSFRRHPAIRSPYVLPRFDGASL
jgi:hypothetical protein